MLDLDKIRTSTLLKKVNKRNRIYRIQKLDRPRLSTPLLTLYLGSSLVKSSLEDFIRQILKKKPKYKRDFIIAKDVLLDQRYTTNIIQNLKGDITKW